MQKIIIVFCLLLLSCGSVAANPVVILGVGQVELGQDNIVMTEGHDKKGDINYNFRVKDGAVWRGAILMPISNISTMQLGNMIKTDVLLNQVVEEKISKNTDILSTEKARRLVIGGKEIATTTIKFTMPGGGMVANMEMTIIPSTDGLKMVAYMCADSDTQYWQPIMQKIWANIP